MLSLSTRAACIAMQDHHVLSIQFLQPEVELATFEMNVAYACTRSGSPHNVIHSASISYEPIQTAYFEVSCLGLAWRCQSLS